MSVSHVIVAVIFVQNNVYFRLGQLTSMAFVHGVAGFHVFSSSVYNYIAGMKVNDIVVGEEEIGDPVIKMVTSEVIASIGTIETVFAFLTSTLD